MKPIRVSYIEEKGKNSNMGKGCFLSVATNSNNKNWDRFIERENELYSRKDEIRSVFARDYTRILHSLAYRRLKHKTQVFFNIGNDHICTRMEHVLHVESVSNTIASYLGLNVELTKAIAIGHDLGHAPFGHQGETIIKELSEKYLDKKFWHEQNGLRFVDKVELLEDKCNKYQNLSLTYAVRDGIISHCGEVDQNAIIPRKELINLDDFQNAGQYQPATWEGCVVKIADKIAYLGRDIEDAIRLNFLTKDYMEYLKEMAKENDEDAINTTVIMHNMIIDICNNSTPEKGICLSESYRKQIDDVKKFNYENIYKNRRLDPFKNYANLVISEIFNALLSEYKGENTIYEIRKQAKYYPELMGVFAEWLVRYCEFDFSKIDWANEISQISKNHKIYGKLEKKELYIQAIIDYISGMTDSYAIKVFNELLAY